jgi:predicted RNase H-like nuclease (RuvC/YqgF family)
MAAAMKPEALAVAEESHWKTWKFKEVITEAVEAENLQLRKKVESFEERYSHQDRVHEAVKSELKSQKAHLTTLQKALEHANSLVRSRDSELAHRDNLLRDAYHQNDMLKERLGQFETNDFTIYGGDSGVYPCLEFIC